MVKLNREAPTQKTVVTSMVIMSGVLVDQGFGRARVAPGLGTISGFAASIILVAWIAAGSLLRFLF